MTMKYPTVKEIQIQVGSLLRVEDDFVVYSSKFHKKQNNTILGIVIKVERSPRENGVFSGNPAYDYTWVRWENGNVTKYLYGDEEVLSV